MEKQDGAKTVLLFLVFRPIILSENSAYGGSLHDMPEV